MRRLVVVLLLALLVAVPAGLVAQVLPGQGGAGAALTLPETLCTNEVGVGLTAQGVLLCGPITPTLLPNLVPANVDVSAAGQVTATHLASPLPVTEGGTGLTIGTAGGLPYYISDTVMGSSGLLPQNAPILGGGLTGPPVPGTRSGTSLEFATIVGTKTVGKQLAFDPLGNVIATATDIGGGPSPGPPLPPGTAGGLPYYVTPTTLASSAVLPQNAPVFGGGPGAAPVTGTRSGTSLEVATIVGAKTSGKQLTFDTLGNVIASASDVGSSGGAVLSVFGRGGNVVGQAGDYTAAQVTNAADRTAANVFPHPTGQTMARLVLLGTTSGTLTIRAPVAAGSALVTLPAGTTDFSSTGGPGQVVHQTSAGGALTVAQVPFSALSGAATAAQVPLLQQMSGVLTTSQGGLDWTDTTVTGTTHRLATALGSLTAGKQVTYDASGNLVASATSVGGADFATITGTAAPSQLPPLQNLTGGPLTIAQGGLGWTDTTFSGTTHVLATVSGTLTPNACVQSNAQGNFVTTGTPCGSGSGSVSTVFGRTGVVVAQAGDYSAGQVSNAADLTVANVFTHSAGQSMRQLVLTGSISGSVTLKAPAVASSTTVILPAGTTDFSLTGGANQVVQQSTSGGAFTVGTLSASNLSNGVVGTGPVLLQNNTQIPALGNLTQNGFVRTSGGIGTLLVDTSVYLTANQTITLTGDAAGSGTTSIPVTVSRLNGVPFAGVVGHLVSFASSNTPADSGLVTAQVLTAAAPFTTGHLIQAAGSTRATVDSGIVATTVCLSTAVCTGYQATLTWGAGLAAVGQTVSVASTESDFLVNGGTTPLVAGAGQGGKMQVLSTGELQYTDGGTPPVLRSGYLVTPQGTSGVLQVADGLRGLTAFAGTQCTTPSTDVMTGLTVTGVAQCRTPTATIAAHVLTDRLDATAPNSVSLASFASGVLVSTVSGGVATLSSVPLPSGSLVGTTQPQTLTQTAVTPRTCPLLNTTTSLLYDLSACDVLTVADLQQAATIPNPAGSATVAQWARMEICSSVPQPLTWGTQWSGGDLALRSETRGGGQCELLLFQYQAATSKLILVADVGFWGKVCLTALSPGFYTNASLTIDSRGCPSNISTGSGSGGGAVGAQGDVQLAGPGASATVDTGVLRHDTLTHITSTQALQAGSGASLLTLRDAGGQTYTHVTATLTAARTELKPDVSGTTMVALSGVGLARGSPAAGWTASELSGDCATSGSNVLLCTRLNGGLFSGTSGNLVSFGAGNIPADSGVAGAQVVTLAGTQTLSNKRAVPRVLPLTSSATFTCNVTTADICKMQLTAATGTFTIDQPAGTPNDGDKLEFWFLCTNSQTFAWHAIFQDSPAVALPTTCPAGTTRWAKAGVEYSTDLAKFQLIAVNF